MWKNKFANNHKNPKGANQNSWDKSYPQNPRSFTFFKGANTYDKSENRKDQGNNSYAKSNGRPNIFATCLIDQGTNDRSEDTEQRNYQNST